MFSSLVPKFSPKISNHPVFSVQPDKLEEQDLLFQRKNLQNIISLIKIMQIFKNISNTPIATFCVLCRTLTRGEVPKLTKHC